MSICAHCFERTWHKSELTRGMKFRRHGSAHVARALHEMARLSALAGNAVPRARVAPAARR